MSKDTVAPKNEIEQGHLTPSQYIISTIVSGWVVDGQDVFSLIERPLEARHFPNTCEQDIWKVLLEIRDEGLIPDLTVMFMKLRPLAKKYAGSPKALEFIVYVQTCQTEVFTQNVNYMVKEVSTEFYKGCLNKIEVESQTISDLSERVKTRNNKIEELSKDGIMGHKKHRNAREIATDLITDLSRSKSEVLVSLGFDTMNAKIPASRGHLMVLAGRAGMGKTTMAMNMLRQQSWAKMKIAVLSLEMSYLEVGGILISQSAMVDVQKIRGNATDGEVDQIYKAMEDFCKTDIAIQDTPAMNLDDIENSIISIKRDMKGLDCVYIDHIHLMKEAVGGFKLREGVTKITARLKEIAKTHKVLIVALCQMNREADKREIKEPKLSDLRESGSIEQDADVIMFMFRESYYKKSDEQCDNTLTKLIVKKNRHSRLNNFSIPFRLDHGSQKLIEFQG